MTPEAERFNGWAAMLGFVAAVGAYVTTGQIIPGWFQALVITVLTVLKSNLSTHNTLSKQQLSSNFKK